MVVVVTIPQIWAVPSVYNPHLCGLTSFAVMEPVLLEFRGDQGWFGWFICAFRNIQIFFMCTGIGKTRF
jgi:hypothetical protein